MSDSDPLAEFRSTGSHDAFARIVQMHVNTVYATARRQVRDAQLAEDVTQAVFIVLLRRAKSIRAEVPLVGWLLKTTYFASRDALKAEARRHRHEQKAAVMKNIVAETMDSDIDPELDRALARLGETDRGIIGLRFLEDKSISEIAGVLDISQDAAAKRLTRAIGKMRDMILRRQNYSAVVSVEAMFAAIPRILAPAHLAGASVAAATSSSLTASSLIAKGTIKMIFWSHAKTAAIIIAAAATLGTVAVGARSIGTAVPPGATVPAPAAVAAQPITAGQQCIGQFSNGPSIELLGVAEHDDATGQPIQWWSANGSPLDFGPYAQMGKVSLSSQRPGDIEREVAIRINDQVRGSAEPASVQWYFVGSGASAGSLPEDDHGRVVKNVDGLVLTLPDDPNGATLHFAVATGPWTTHLITRPDSNSSMAEGDISLLTSEGFEIRGRTHVIVTIASSKALPDEAERLIAITTSGKTIQSYFASESATASAMIMEMIVPAALKTIKEFRFQTRPWNQSLDIRHISLHADKHTNVEIVSRNQFSNAK